LHWSLEDPVGWFASNIRNKPVHYVLNLRVDSCQQSGKQQLYLLPDTSGLPFSLFNFDKRARVSFLY